jgi:outer membrane protein TolC
MDYKVLELKIVNSYTNGITASDAENLAGEFLGAQIQVSEELKQLDLNARLLKSLLKEKKATLFVAKATESEKKPSDTLLNAIVDSNEEVAEAQNQLDSAEVERDELSRLFKIFNDAHIFYRGISKGKFNE